MESYPASKRRATRTHAATWSSLEGIVLGEINQSRKGRHRMIRLAQDPQSGQVHRDGGGMDGGDGELTFNGDTVSVLQ